MELKTKKTTKLLATVNGNKAIQKNLLKLRYYTNENFVNDAKRYIKAIKQGRVINSIGSVSSSGMSRAMKFLECYKGKFGYQYLNFYCLFVALGYTESKAKNHYFTISGCGMDMVFYTNYSIIHNLYNLGFINKKDCEKLSQMTPQTI